MKKYFLALGQVIFLATVQAQAPADSSFQKAMEELVHKRIEAFDSGDTALWSPYVAADYFIATPTGKVITKRDVMQGFSPPLKGMRTTFYFEDVHVIKKEDIAVLSYRIKEKVWLEEQVDSIPDLRKTDTYILRDGRWLLLASHETFYPPRRTPVSIDASILDRYTGRYEVMPSLVYTITREKNRLLIRENANGERVALYPLSPNVFFSQPDSGFFNEGGAGDVLFIQNGIGKAAYLVFRRIGTQVKARRLP